MHIAPRFSSVVLAALLILPSVSPAAEVTQAEQQVVIDHFQTIFVLPAFNRWRFDDARPYQLGGRVVCGHVNYQNSNRRYVGNTPFYVVVKDGKYVEGGLVGNFIQDPAGTIGFAYKLLCKRP